MIPKGALLVRVMIPASNDWSPPILEKESLARSRDNCVILYDCMLDIMKLLSEGSSLEMLPEKSL